MRLYHYIFCPVFIGCIILSIASYGQDCNATISEDFSVSIWRPLCVLLDPGVGGTSLHGNSTPFAGAISVYTNKPKKAQFRHKYSNDQEWVTSDVKEIQSWSDLWYDHYLQYFSLPKKIPPFEIYYQGRVQCNNGIWTNWSNSEHSEINCDYMESFCFGSDFLNTVTTKARRIEFDFYEGAKNYEVRIKSPQSDGRAFKSTSSFITVDNLEINSTYIMEVRLTCEDGQKTNWVELYEYHTDCDAPNTDEISANYSHTTTSYVVEAAVPALLFQHRLRQKGSTTWITSPISSLSSYTFNNIVKDKIYEIQSKVSCNSINLAFALWTDWSASKEVFVPIQCTQPTGDYGARNISNNTATLYCSSGHEGGIVNKHMFRYRLNAESEWRNRETTNNSVDVSNLTDGSLYVMQVQHECGDQNTTGNWSSMRNFTTDNCNAVDVTQITHQNVTYTTAQLKSLTGRTGYIWKYRKAGTTNATELPQTTNRTTTITGLSSATTYQYALKVNCDPSISAYSDWKEFTTDICELPSGSIVESEITNTSIELVYTASQGQIDWQYKKLENSNWNKIESQVGSTLIDGLSANTFYQYRMRYVCNRTDAVYSEWTTTEQFATRCDAIINRFSNVSSNSVTVVVSDAKAEGYNLRYRRANTSTWTSVIIDTTSTVISGLQQGTEYEFQVSGICPYASGFWSVSSFVTTSSNRQAPCDSPSINEVSIRSVTDQSAEIYCSRPGMARYQFRYLAIPSTSWITLPWANSDLAMLTGLSPSTGYAVEVRLDCGNNNISPWSHFKLFRTLVESRSSNSTCFRPGIESLLANQVDATSAQLNCFLYADSYQFRWRDITSTDSNFVNRSDSLPHLIITNLKPSSIYEFQCRIKCNGAFGDYSYSSFFRTPRVNTCPSPIWNECSATDINEQEATLSCLLKSEKYLFRYKKEKATDWIYSDTVRLPDYTITHLEPGQKYVFQVILICGSQTQPSISNIKSFSTPKSCPTAAVNQFSTNTIKAKSVVINGKNVSSDYYYLRYKIKGDLFWKSEPEANTPTWTLDSLRPNTTYEYQIKLYCNFSKLAMWTPSITFTTASTTALSNQSLSQIKLYPNPATNWIKVMQLNAESARYTIMDISGRIVSRGKLLQDKPIDTENLQAGIYIMYIQHLQKGYNAKFIKNE